MRIIILMCLMLSGCSEDIFKEKPEESKVEVKSKNYDLVINDEIELKENMTITAAKLIITRNARIRTLDKNLIIVVDELVGEGGVIENFKESQQALWGKDGRSGGMVAIIAKSAEGSLQVRLSGENGGNGKNGAITIPGRHPGCAGTDGGNGGNGGSIFSQTPEGFQISVSNIAGKAGEKGLRGVSPQSDPPDRTVLPPCAPDTIDGIDGKPGSSGSVCISNQRDGRCQ